MTWYVTIVTCDPIWEWESTVYLNFDITLEGVSLVRIQAIGLSSMDEKGSFGPRLLGTTGALCQGSVLESLRKRSAEVGNDFHQQDSDKYASHISDDSNYFKSAQW